MERNLYEKKTPAEIEPAPYKSKELCINKISDLHNMEYTQIQHKVYYMADIFPTLMLHYNIT